MHSTAARVRLQASSSAAGPAAPCQRATGARGCWPRRYRSTTSLPQPGCGCRPSPAEPYLLMASSVPAGQGCVLRAPHQEAGMVVAVRIVRGPAAARLDLGDDGEGRREVGEAAALRTRAGQGRATRAGPPGQACAAALAGHAARR